MVIFQIKILRRDKPPQRTTNTLFYWTTWKIQHIVLFTLEIISKKKRTCMHTCKGGIQNRGKIYLQTSLRGSGVGSDVNFRKFVYFMYFFFTYYGGNFQICFLLRIPLYLINNWFKPTIAFKLKFINLCVRFYWNKMLFDWIKGLWEIHCNSS